MPAVQEDSLADVVTRVAQTTGISEAEAERILGEAFDQLSESADRFVVRRHRELHTRGLTNDRIWPLLSEELSHRRFPAQTRKADQEG